MDGRLEELVEVFAADPRRAFIDGGPNLAALPWKGLSWSADQDIIKRSNTFEIFCTSLALRDYRFPLRTEVDPAGGGTSVFTGGFHDRVLDGVAISWGDKSLTSVSEARNAVKSNSGAGARLLFVQAKMSDRIRDEDVERFGGNVQGFLTEPNYLRARTSEQIRKQREIYDALRGDGGVVPDLDVMLVFMFIGERGNFYPIVQVRDRILTNLGNHKDLGGARFGMEIWDEDDICQAAMLAGISIKRSLGKVEALHFDGQGAAKGYLAIVPGQAIVRAFAPAKADLGAEEIELDPQFFLENPRHDLGDRISDNAGAGALARDIRKGRQGQAFLCHNGLTVVGRDVEKVEDSIVITTPQVVNGCQSSYALGRLNKHLSGTYFTVKIVVTSDEELMDSIVLGANTQEEIETWDLLARRRFVRELEREFDRNWKHRLWLERRHRWRDVWQEANVPAYPQMILTPRQLMDGFAASFLGRAHTAHLGPAQVLPLVQETDETGRVRGRIFADEHEPALYRAVGWLIAAGRMWGQGQNEPWNDHPDQVTYGQYRYRHQFVGALWRVADANPQRVNPEDLARGRAAQERANTLIDRLADSETRKQLTGLAAEAISAALKKSEKEYERLKSAGKVRGRRMRDPRQHAWFTELVAAEADVRRQAM